MRLLDNAHIVNGWTHADINGAGVSSDVVSLKNYARCAIVLDFGNTTAGGDADITVLACDDLVPTHTVALNGFTYRKSAGSTSDDSFSAPATITDSKIDYVLAGEILPNTDDNCIVVIDVDTAQVKAAGSDYAYDCLQLTMGDPGQGCPVGCKFILYDARHSSGVMPSAIA